jgi:hypothetical protein
LRHGSKNIDERTSRIEQILPTLATNGDFAGFATKEDLRAFPTREDLNVFPTRDEVMAIVREEGERTRLHFDVVAEGMKGDIKRIAEGSALRPAQTTTGTGAAALTTSLTSPSTSMRQQKSISRPTCAAGSARTP